MSKIGIFSDLHIQEKDFEELSLVCSEIYDIFSQNKVEEIFYLGDALHRNNPTPLEIDFLANFLKRFYPIPIKLVIATSHESSSSTISHLTHFGILSDNIVTAPYFDLTRNNLNIFLGHFMVKESLCGFKEEKSIEDFNQDFIFLGHQHSYQQLHKTILDSMARQGESRVYHIGSCRYINFNEAQDPKKYVAILNTDKNCSNPLQLIELKSIYPMIDIKVLKSSKSEPLETPLKAPITQKRQRGRPPLATKTSCKALSQGTQNPSQIEGLSALLAVLDKINPKTKVRVTFYNFKDFADYLPFEENYKKKFYVYKRETKFDVVNSSIEASKKETLSVKDYLKKWIEEKKIEPQIAEILLKEFKEI